MLEEDDFYWENGFIVFTSAYHLKRGTCCKNQCRHCPWNFGRNNKVKEHKRTVQDETGTGNNKQ